MQTQDTRPDRFGRSQTALRAANRDLPHLRIYAQAHVGPPNRITFVVVHGVGEDRDRRRRVRAEVGDLLQHLGYTAELEPKRDVYDVAPRRPSSMPTAEAKLKDIRRRTRTHHPCGAKIHIVLEGLEERRDEVAERCASLAASAGTSGKV